MEGTVVQPDRYLSPEQLKDYEDFEQRISKLTQLERRYYNLLQRWVYVQHLLQVEQMDKVFGKL
jgi:DNA-binding ferritin-like protein (Dps family)